jgi:hypothetical protein
MLVCQKKFSEPPCPLSCSLRSLYLDSLRSSSIYLSSSLRSSLASLVTLSSLAPLGSVHNTNNAKCQLMPPQLGHPRPPLIMRGDAFAGRSPYYAGRSGSSPFGSRQRPMKIRQNASMSARNMIMFVIIAGSCVRASLTLFVIR